jgi:hypothetical protein
VRARAGSSASPPRGAQSFTASPSRHRKKTRRSRDYGTRGRRALELRARADVYAQTRSNIDVSRWSTDHQPMGRSRRSLGGRNPSPTRRWNEQIRFERPFAYLFAALGVLAAIVGLASWVSSAPTPHAVGGVVLALVAAALAPFAFSSGWALARRVTPVDRLAIWLGALLAALGTVGSLTLMSAPMLIGTLFSPRPAVGLFAALGVGVMFLFIVTQCVSATTAVWTEEGRVRLRGELARLGSAAPFLFPIALFINVLLLFALATSYLVAWGVVSFAQENPSNARVVAFYCWHFFDLVPLVDIPQTLHWSRPLTYPDWSIGLLVLGFQVTGVLPVIALIRAFWRLRAAHEPNTDAPPLSDGRS